MKQPLLVLIASLVATAASSQNSVPTYGTSTFDSGYDRTMIIKDSRPGAIGWHYMEWQLNTGTRDWVMGRRPGGEFTFFKEGLADVMTINTAGKVGIGTITPGARLDVAGDGKIAESLHLGPLMATSGIGKISLSGSGNEVSITSRSISSYINVPSQGERWSIYSDGPTHDGKLKIWSGVDLVTFDKSGNVGIATTTPAYKLDVAGTINATSILLNGQPLSSGTSTQWNLTGNDITNPNTTARVYVNSSFAGPKFEVFNGKVLGSTAGNHELIARLSSNCGAANYAMNNHWIVRSSNGNDWLSTRFHDGISIDASFLTPRTDTRVWWERDPSNNIQSWGDQNNQYMTIYQGKVGIGTQTPTELLTVRGTIYSKEVRVDLSVPGPDYVFDESYELKSLDDVKAYIDENKHLPEVPSAAEMEKNGVELSKMNMLLLKKVEELTLYVIELKKEIGEMKKQK